MGIRVLAGAVGEAQILSKCVRTVCILVLCTTKSL